jgi:hypothetical protein
MMAGLALQQPGGTYVLKVFPRIDLKDLMQFSQRRFSVCWAIYMADCLNDCSLALLFFFHNNAPQVELLLYLA